MVCAEVPTNKKKTMTSTSSDFALAKDVIVAQSDLEHKKKIELLDLQTKCTLEAHHSVMELMELQKELVRAQISSITTSSVNVNSVSPSMSCLPTYQHL